MVHEKTSTHNILLLHFLNNLRSLCQMYMDGCVETESPHSPRGAVGQLSEGAWVSDQLVQDCDNLAKLWPFAAPLLPAVQHELVQHHRTVHWGGKTVALIYCFDHLWANEYSVVEKRAFMYENQHMRLNDGGGDSHPGWTSPSRVALRMRLLPT